MTHDSYKTFTLAGLLACAGLLASCGLIALAELPPSAYKERQEKAPEHLVIRVRSARTSETEGPRLVTIAVTIEAQVEQVLRSRTGLKAGEVINISYVQRRYKEPRVGPGEVPILREGQTYPAYLAKDGALYTPAAGGYSFREVK